MAKKKQNTEEILVSDWNNFDKLRADSQTLEPLSTRFNTEVLDRGMYKVFKNYPGATMACQFNGTAMNCLITGGRVLITLENKKLEADISFVAAETGGAKAGLQSFNGRKSEFEKMVDDVRDGIQANKKKKFLGFASKKLHVNGVHPVG